jgi:hypothetical protein
MGRWRIFWEETYVAVPLPPRRRGPGPFKRLLWAILGLAAGCAVMWFLVRNPTDWRQYPALLKHAARGVPSGNYLAPPPGEFTERGADGELAGLEQAEGIYPVAHESAVYAEPDTRSQVLDHIYLGKRVRVTGSTPNFLRIAGGDTGGYIPFAAARVMNPNDDETWLCYSIETESKLLKYPNAHSDVVGSVGQGTDLPLLGMGLHHFPLVRNYSGGSGYVTSDEVLGHGRCPDD